MSRLVPLLRHSPIATTTTITPATTTQTRRGIGHCTAGRRHHGRKDIVAEKKHGSRDITREGIACSRIPKRTAKDIFISSLVAAGTCTTNRVRLASGQPGSQQRRYFCSSRRQQQQAEVASPDDPPKISQKEYHRLVDIYAHHEKAENQTEAKKTHHPLASRLFMTPEQEQAVEQNEQPDPYRRKLLPPEDAEQRSIIKALRQLVSARPGTIPLRQVWSIYQSVHPPRTVYLKDGLLRRLLLHLGFVEYWHEKDAMQRYFQLLDDCVAADVPVDKQYWTTAIAYAGRWMKHVTSREIKTAIETWMRMEEAGHTADHVTLNVLFDVAVKAGRFALADTIFKELNARNMSLDRHFRGSLIYYAGLKRDGDDVRRAFREFVAAGEIVDTTVMNAVVLSLFRAGEAAAAEQVFTNMKRLGEEKCRAKSPKGWVQRKELRTELTLTAHQLRAEKEFHESSFFGAPFSSDERREQVQRLSPVAPDSYTYTFMLQYHATTSGDVERIWQLLREMGEQGLRPHTAAYTHILKGFRLHGGYAFSGWNHHRLEIFWKTILEDRAVDSPMDVPVLPEAAAQNAVIETKHRLDPHLDCAAKVVRPADSAWEVGNRAADDALQSGTNAAYSTSNGYTNNATAIPLAGIVRSTAESTAQHEVDDYDMLGAMMSEQAHTRTGNHGMTDQSTVKDEIVKLGSLERGTSTSAIPSFLESVSLKHLTNAALLPEGGAGLQDAEVSKVNPELPSDALPRGNITGPSNDAEVDTTTKEMSETIGAASSFIDSFSLRHLTDAALLPEGGTPLEEVNTSKGDGTSSDSMLKYVPQALIDVNPKVVVESTTSSDGDNFDALPIWRRGRKPFINHDAVPLLKNDAGIPQIERRPLLAPSQKPVALTNSMALEAVRAFYQCCGRDRMLQVWDEISMRWHDATEEERTRVANEVGQMARHASRYDDLNRASR